MKFFVTGDTHGDLGRVYDWIDRMDFNDENITVIILGDCGLYWRKDGEDATAAIAYHENCYRFNLMFIDGNHENFDILGSLPIMRDGLCHISKHITYIPRGTVLNLDTGEGIIKVACCGGADSVDKARRTKHLTWWEQETITQDDIDRIPAGHYDYVFTHACPINTFNDNKVYLVDTMLRLDQNKIDHNSEEKLQELANKINFDYWFFGHYHTDKQLNAKFTCLLNNFIELQIPIKQDLNDTYNCLLENDDFEITDFIQENGHISHIYLKDKWDLMYYCLIAPHSGNGYKYLLRANTQKTFDRWSVCEFEEEFNKEYILLTFLTTNKEKIYREVLKEVLYYYDID